MKRHVEHNIKCLQVFDLYCDVTVSAVSVSCLMYDCFLVMGTTCSYIAYYFMRIYTFEDLCILVLNDMKLSIEASRMVGNKSLHHYLSLCILLYIFQPIL